MVALMRKLWNDEAGQGLPEYALLVAAVVVMVVGATTLFAEEVQGLFDSIGTFISGHSPIDGADTTTPPVE